MKNQKVPTTLHLYPTMRCPLNCTYCYVNDVNRDYTEMSIETYTDLLIDAKEMGIKVVDIAGGEPFAFKGIVTLLNKCKENGQKTKLVSNGLFLDRYMEEVEPKEQLIDELHISLDSHDESIHDTIRMYKGLHKIVVKNLELYIKRQYGNVIINYVLQKESFLELEKMLDFVYSQKVKGIDIQYIVNVSDKTKKNQYSLSLKEIKESLQRIVLWYHYLGDSSFQLHVSIPNYMYPIIKTEKNLMDGLKSIHLSFSHGLVGSNFFQDMVIVKQNGCVTGGTSMINNEEWMIGNILESSIKEIWDRNRMSIIKKVHERSNYLLAHGCCKKCKAGRFCKGGDPVEFSKIGQWCSIKDEMLEILK